MKLPKEIRERRELAYLYKEFDDVNLPREVYQCSAEELVNTVVNFFVNGSELIYPAKSYFVAIVYSACIMKHWGKYFSDITDVLRCEDLLVDDDYFKPYNEETCSIYNEILSWFEHERVEVLSLPSTDKTQKYFIEEFLV